MEWLQQTWENIQGFWQFLLGIGLGTGGYYIFNKFVDERFNDRDYHKTEKRTAKDNMIACMAEGVSGTWEKPAKDLVKVYEVATKVRLLNPELGEKFQRLMLLWQLASTLRSTNQNFKFIGDLTEAKDRNRAIESIAKAAGNLYNEVLEDIKNWK